MSKPIRGAVQREIGQAPVLEELTIDDPGEGELLVEVVAVGVCHTDMVMRDGHVPIPRPAVLGHEGAGIVTQVGPGVEEFRQGDHVILSFASCGQCPSCKDQQPAYCHAWFPLNFGGGRPDGSTALRDSCATPVHSHIFGQSSFASHSLVRARNAVKVDADLPLELLGPLGCGVQTGAGTILNVLKPGPDSSLAVIGTGAVGLSAIMAARISGVSTIVAVDLNVERIELAKELGATHGFQAGEVGLAECARRAGAELGLDFIIDTTGSPEVCSAAIDALAPRGQLALVGAYPSDGVIAAQASFLMSGGRVIRGVVEGGADPKRFIPELIRHYRAGRFPFDRLIEFFDFEDISAAISAGESGQVVKPVVRMTNAESSSPSMSCGQ